ncbi:migration and invasion enhancer 1 isoform X2 [Bubalus kerabau]|uniref:migration and invasion enhancer 1 isoform X2 n=1 Tax=Bubalus bubalis TaxID=89462 RepID=UPI001D1201DE|nr:migration and invasion enhancer 1 isoform X2 [Bubalus bubalis]XP_055431960.1 migration and invasion enhancer 1 isoform X2 [Bubalus carabanensis]
MSGDTGTTSVAPPPGETEPGHGVRIVVEYCEPCGFEATYLELASAVKEQYPGIEIESRLGGTGDTASHSTSLPSSSLRPSEEPVTENPSKRSPTAALLVSSCDWM